jgi:hypothetical protein
VPALEPPLQSLAAQFPGARYVFFGFGDQHYLLAKNRNGPVLLGALWPGKGLILATTAASTPQAAFGEEQVIALTVTASQAHSVQAFIGRSLNKDAVQPYAQGPYEGSLYYAATPKYSALHTCNTWAAEALKAAPLPVHSVGVIFAGQLWGQVRRLAHRRLSLSNPPQSQGGFDPFWHTTVVPEPGGTTTVVFAGGGGLLLLMQPDIIDAATNTLSRIFITGSS